jgi:hypothetical protein
MAEGTSQSSGRPYVFGFTPSGEYIIVIFEEPQSGVAYPVTAYEVPEPWTAKGTDHDQAATSLSHGARDT